MSKIYLINSCATESEREKQAETLNFYIKANYGYGRMLDRFAVWMCPAPNVDNRQVFEQLDERLKFTENEIFYREDATFFDEMKNNEQWEHIFLAAPWYYHKTLISALCGLSETWNKKIEEYPEKACVYLIENGEPRGFLCQE